MPLVPDAPARSLVETVAAKYAEFLECAAARDLKATLCMDDGMCSCRRDVAFIANAVLDAIAEPNEVMFNAVGCEPNTSNLICRDEWCDVADVWRSMIAALRKEIENG